MSFSNTVFDRNRKVNDSRDKQRAPLHLVHFPLSWIDEHLYSYICVHLRMFQRSPELQHRKGHSQPQSVSFYAIFGVTLSTNNSHN